MANFVYNYGKFLLANGSLNLLTDNIALLQDNYQLSHPQLGQHIWCLVPVAGPIPGVDETAKREYQIIFN